MRNRHDGLDFLRVCATFAVVWLHVSATVVTRNPDSSSFIWWAGNISDSFSRWCVPVFVMINGALALSSAEVLSPVEYIKKRTRRLLPPLVFWSIFYILFQIATNDAYGVKYAAKSILLGTPYYHLWYLYMIIGLSFLTPYLHKLVTVLSRDALRLLILVGLMVVGIEFMSLESRHLTFLPESISYVPYFLAGYYLLNYTAAVKVGQLPLLIFFCGLLIALLTGGLISRLGEKSWLYMYSYFNPLVIIMSISVFKYLVHKPLSLGVFRFLASISLGIYALHPFWIWVILRFQIMDLKFHSLIGIPIESIVVFGLSALSAVVVAKIPYIRKVVC